MGVCPTEPLRAPSYKKLNRGVHGGWPRNRTAIPRWGPTMHTQPSPTIQQHEPLITRCPTATRNALTHTMHVTRVCTTSYARGNDGAMLTGSYNSGEYRKLRSRTIRSVAHRHTPVHRNKKPDWSNRATWVTGHHHVSAREEHLTTGPKLRNATCFTGKLPAPRTPYATSICTLLPHATLK